MVLVRSGRRLRSQRLYRQMLHFIGVGSFNIPLKNMYLTDCHAIDLAILRGAMYK